MLIWFKFNQLERSSSRSKEEDDFAKIAEYFDRAASIAVKLKETEQGKNTLA